MINSRELYLYKVLGMILCSAKQAIFLFQYQTGIFLDLFCPIYVGSGLLNSRMMISYKETLLKNRTKEEG